MLYTLYCIEVKHFTNFVTVSETFESKVVHSFRWEVGGGGGGGGGGHSGTEWRRNRFMYLRGGRALFEDLMPDQ